MSEPAVIRPEPRRWTLRYPQRPLLENQLSAHGSYHQRAAMRAEWRQAFRILAMQHHIPSLDRIRVTVEHTKAGKGKVPDVCACAPSVKAAIDGLVDAGVIPDDGPAHLVAVEFLAPTRGTEHAVSLTIEEADG